MKIKLSILLVLVILFGNTLMCYAAPDTVGIAVYEDESTEIIELPNDTIPASHADDEVFVDSEAIPQGTATSLPKTGGIPAELFYVTGGILIIFALIISRKRPKVTKS